MWRYAATAVFSVLVSTFVFASVQSPRLSPGAQPFTPTRIDWLTTTLQANLRDEEMETNGYMLQITSPNPETILIYVRYTPDVNRRAMNLSIDTARKVIQITAKSYGWDNWVKIREDISLAIPGRKNSSSLRQPSVLKVKRGLKPSVVVSLSKPSAVTALGMLHHFGHRITFEFEFGSLQWR